MRYCIPIGTEIFPYSREKRLAGPGRLTTDQVTFERSDELERVSRPDPDTNRTVQFICLSLSENPSRYDSYLVRVSGVIPAEE